MRENPGSFEDLEDFISSLASPGIRPGLERMGRLLDFLGNPEKDFPAVQIVGTNGKGSTAAFSASILKEAGYRTALYTSPHLESPDERLLVDGVPLSLNDWARACEKISKALGDNPALASDPPTYFELVTAAALLLCSQNSVDIVVAEAGLGGRLDATNLLGGVELSLIASISLDHSDFLGNTLEEIAGEKFAVMRRGVPAFFSGSPQKLVPLFKEKAQEKGALPFVLFEEVKADDISITEEGVSFIFRSGEKRLKLNTPLHGSFQVENCSLAVAGMIALSTKFPLITDDAILKGVQKARWPGRFEILRPVPPLILDGAHNPDWMRRLVESLGMIYGANKPAALFASMKDKDYSEGLSLLKEGAGFLICTSVPGNLRSEDPENLAAAALKAGWTQEKVKIIPDPREALFEAEKSRKGTVCCGSLYFVGHMRTMLFSNRKELGF
ncbi:MAG: bifunctional folylpolyglutamate synthase/dihydrofolate synthase [Synergistaceae bacterium]|nr:bifunctional folylpolyglutamate synthase/dihydrofolate synthase [Synergistaceae bacterium]